MLRDNMLGEHGMAEIKLSPDHGGLLWEEEALLRRLDQLRSRFRLLGPVGMVLAVPLTVALKLALESGEGTRWAAVLMG